MRDLLDGKQPVRDDDDGMPTDDTPSSSVPIAGKPVDGGGFGGLDPEPQPGT